MMIKNKSFGIIFFVLAMFLILSDNISADIIDYNGGQSGSVSSTLGRGKWVDQYVGLKIGIVSSDGILEDVEIVLNNNPSYQIPSSMKFSTNNYSKPFQETTTIKWASINTSNYVKSTYVPDAWGYSTFTNLDEHLSDNEYSNLKGLLELKKNNKNIFQTLGPGDYIIVEPMTYIGGYFGTAFELANAFFTDNDDCWSKDKFCYLYGRRVFGGSSSNTSGGVLYTTINLSQNVTIGNKTLTYFYNDGSSSGERKERNNCLKSNTCGRGMGVYRYDAIYDSYNITYHGNGGLYNGSDTWIDNIRGPVLYGEEYTTWSNDNFFVREGYVFTGWNEKSDGTGTDWTSWINKPWKWTYTRSVDLYAQWKPMTSIKYTLDLNYCVDGAINLSLPRNPTNFSYDFKLNGVDQTTTYFLNSISSGTSYDVLIGEVNSDYEFKGYHVGVSGSCDVTDNSKSINGTITQNTLINLVFESSCDKKLQALKQSDGSYNISGLFDLYKFYLDKPGTEKKDYRGLLNISNPTCTTKAEPSKEIKNLTCLSASTLSHANFNELNLSDYDEIVPSTGESYAGFCLSSMYLKNNLGVQKFYSKSGELLVKQSNDNSEIQLYNSSYNPVRVCGTDVATTTIRKMCYVLPDRVSSYNDYSSSDDVTLYFGDNDINDSADKLLKTREEIINDGTISRATTNSLRLYEYEKQIKYKLNTIYLENISGKTINNGNKYLNGVLSKFNSTSGTIPFKITYRGKTYGKGENLCTYETKPELILNNKLNLEFRIIDTKNPFNRKTMSNWSNGIDNSKDNDTVKTYILNATNSYGIKKDETDRQPPIYEITLTPTEIENIREYNKNVPYDNYKVDCEVDSNNNEVCKNTFLENLRDGKVIIYDESDEVVKTLTNTENLSLDFTNNIVNNSVVNTNIQNGVDITKKICTPVTSSTNGNVPTGKYNLGDEYKCQVAKGVEYNFYVVGTCGDDKINMIMSQNLETSGIEWINETDFYAKGGKSNDWIYANGGRRQNTKGPQTVLNRLYELTSNWSNIVSYNYTLIDDIDDFKNNYKNNWANEHHPLSLDPDIEIYKPIEQNAVKTRLLTRNEANNCGCARTFGTCPDYLKVGVTSYANSTGYWLSNSFSHIDVLGNSRFTSANDMVADSGEESAVFRDDINGIRPVITVYKSQIS